MKAPPGDLDARRMTVHLRAYEEVVSNALQRLDAERIVERIWDRDHTVWRPDPDGIADRLGWLDLPSAMRDEASAMTAFAAEVKRAG